MRPKINSMLGHRDVPDNLWIKCPETGEMVFHTDLQENQWVIPTSGYHMKISAKNRLTYLFDDGKFEELPRPAVQDPLKFRDSKKYSDRLRDVRAKTGLEDSILAGIGTVKGLRLVACAHDFSFIGGSLGMAAGEAIIRAFEIAIENKCPLTNPTTGGVSASYAMLGDIHIAEPGAEICFAGKRVIEQTIHEKLPEGFQTSEYLMEHGMVDMVVPRQELPDTLARLLKIMMNEPMPASSDVAKDGAAGKPANVAEGKTDSVKAKTAAIPEKITADG